MQLKNILLPLLVFSFLKLGFILPCLAQRVVFEEELHFKSVLVLARQLFNEELTEKERQIVDSIKLEFDGTLDYSSHFRIIPLSKKSWKLSVSSGFIFKAALTAQAFVLNNDKVFNRKGIYYFYTTLYDPLYLYLVRSYHFAAVNSENLSRYDSVLRTAEFYTFSTNMLLFCILHEVGHIVLGHFNKKNTKDQHLEADTWAIKLMYKDYQNNNRPGIFRNFAFSNSVREALNLSYYRDDSKQFYIPNTITEVSRIDNFNRVLDSLYCHSFISDSLLCRDLKRRKKASEQELKFLYEKKKIIEGLKPVWYSSIKNIKNIKTKILDSIYLKDSVTARFMKHALGDSLSELLDNPLFKPEISLGNLDLLAEALLKGTWDTEPDFHGALTIYETIANLHHWTLFGRMLALSASSFNAYNKWQERAAIFSGLINETLRNYPRAAYYYKIGREFCLLLPKEFYNRKILNVEQGEERLIRIRSYLFY